MGCGGFWEKNLSRGEEARDKNGQIRKMTCSVAHRFKKLPMIPMLVKNLVLDHPTVVNVISQESLEGIFPNLPQMSTWSRMDKSVWSNVTVTLCFSNSCECNISRMPSGSVFKLGTNVLLDSRIN